AFERGVARVTGSRLEVAARSHINAFNAHLGTETRRGTGDDIDVVLRVWAQAVIDVNGNNVVSRFAREHEQGQRVGASAARNNHSRAGGTTVELDPGSSPAPTSRRSSAVSRKCMRCTMRRKLAYTLLRFVARAAAARPTLPSRAITSTNERWWSVHISN